MMEVPLCVCGFGTFHVAMCMSDYVHVCTRVYTCPCRWWMCAHVCA